MDCNQGIGETLIPIGNLRLLDDLPGDRLLLQDLAEGI